MVQRSIPAGYKVGTRGLVKYSKEAQYITEALSEDERTVNMMVNMANTIHLNIIMMGDFPRKHATGRISMVDLAIDLHGRDPL